MKYEDISPVMRAFVGTWQVFRLLGYESDNIFFMTARSARHRGVLSVFVHLEAQGKEFAVELGPTGTTEDLSQAEYQQVARALLAGEVSQVDRDRMLYECEAFVCKVDLMVALLQKGFVSPRTQLSPGKA